MTATTPARWHPYPTTLALTLTLTLTRCDDGYYLPDGAAITTTSGCSACPAGAVCRGTYFPPIALVGYGKVRLIELVTVAAVIVVVAVLSPLL